MPLLHIDQLTVRFGGLTAVNQVDCAVEPGQVFAVIGPNGAGKTTVFNVITGIYEPTVGRILFQGREPRRAWSIKTLLLCFAVACCTAVAAVLLTANLDKLWVAVVKRPFAGGRGSFSLVAAVQDFFHYLRHEPTVVYAPDASSAGQEPWKVVAHDGQTLSRFAFESDARTEAERLAATNEDRSGLWTAWIAAIGGMVVGAAGTAAVWSRARRTPDVIALEGIARTFQNIRLFQNMTALENVLVGMDRAFRAGWLTTVLHTRRWRREEDSARLEARKLLEFVGLERQASSLAKNLPYGDQRRLEIARALATRPKLLLLDEPAAGMNPIESERLVELIRRIRDSGVTVLLIEHHMPVVMGISDRIAVLDYGSKIAEGTPAEVRSNPRVIEAYLGKEEAA